MDPLIQNGQVPMESSFETPRNAVTQQECSVSRNLGNFAELHPSKSSPLIITSDCELNDIPTFYLNDEQCQDPIKLIESVKDQGIKYGAIKVKLPESQNHTLQRNINLDDDFQFQSSSLLFSSQEELSSRLEFFSKLIECYKSSSVSQSGQSQDGAVPVDPNPLNNLAKETVAKDVMSSSNSYIPTSSTNPEPSMQQLPQPDQLQEQQDGPQTESQAIPDEPTKSSISLSSEKPSDGQQISQNGTSELSSNTVKNPNSTSDSNNQMITENAILLPVSQNGLVKTENEPIHAVKEEQNQAETKSVEVVKEEQKHIETKSIHTNEIDENNGLSFMNHIPVISGKSIDLYRLFKCVQMNKGYSNVTANGLWKNICLDLSLDDNFAETLRNSYIEIIYPFEKVLTLESIDKTAMSQSADDITTINENGKRTVDRESDASNLDTKRLCRRGEHPVVIGSSRQFSRSIKSKISKGFPLHAPNKINHSKGGKISGRNELNHVLREIIDNFEIFQDDVQYYKSRSPVYKLSDYMNEDIKLQNFISSQFREYFIDSNTKKAITHCRMEELFQKIASGRTSSDLKVHFGMDIPSNYSGFGFMNCTKNLMSNGNNNSDSLFPWNLHNIPILPNSLLGTFSENDMTNVRLTSPRLNVSGTLTVSNWSCQDQFTQSACFHHLGSSKYWSFIPASDFNKFEELVKEITDQKTGESFHKSNLKSEFFEQLIKNSQEDTLLNVLEGTTSKHLQDRFPHTNAIFQESIKQSTIKYNQDILIPTSLLKEKGINFYQTVQNPGEFIIQYPKSYSSNKSFGVNVTEEVNFATNCWLDYALEGEQWLSNQGILPNFSTFKLLINLIQIFDSGKSIGFDSDTYGKVKSIYEDISTRELELRQAVRKFKIKETVIDEKLMSFADSITDVGLRNGFPSNIVVTDKRDKTKMSITLQDFLDQKDKWTSSKDYGLELQLFYSDEKLRSYSKIISSYSIDYEKWIDEYETSLNENEQLTLKMYKSLLSDGEKIASAVKTVAKKDDEKLTKFKRYLNSLKLFIDNSNQFIEECQNLLAIKHQQRIRNNTESQRVSLQDLVKLIERIPSLNFSSVETDQILELQQEIENFDRASRTLITKKNKTFQEFNDLINLGESFGIDIPSLRFITRIRDRIKWIKVFNLIDKGADPYSDKKEVFSLKNLLDFFQESKNVLSADDVEMFDKIQLIVQESIKFNNEVSEFIKYEYVEEVDLNTLEKIAETFRLEKIFLSSDNYNKLSKLHVNTHLISQLQDLTIASKTFQYSDVKQLQTQLRESELKFNPDIFVKQLSPAESWVNKLWDVVRDVQVITTMDKDVDLDHLNLKASLNQALVEKLYQLHYKSEFNFSEEDQFEKSSAYFTRYAHGSGEEENKDAPIYCICREYEFGTMIECDHCNEWYHVSCINKDQKETEEENYVCPVCRLIESGQMSNDFLLHQTDLSQMIDIKMSGDTLRTYPVNERKALDELCERYTQFHGNTRQSIEEVRFGAEPLNMKVDRLMFLLRKIYGSGIIMQDLLAQVVLLIRQYQYELVQAHSGSEAQPSSQAQPASQIQPTGQVQTTNQSQETSQVEPANQPEQPIHTVPPQGQPIAIPQSIGATTTSFPLQQQEPEPSERPVFATSTAMENLLAAATLNAAIQEPVGEVLNKIADNNPVSSQPTIAQPLNSTQPVPVNQGASNIASTESSNIPPKEAVELDIDPTPLISFVNGTSEIKSTEN